MSFITEEQIEEFKKNNAIIVAAELSDTDGNIRINTCIQGMEPDAALLISSLVDSVAKKQNITFGKMLERVRVAHSLTTTFRLLDDLANKVEGGNE